MSTTTELAVVIPTRDRREVLKETLRRLGATTASSAPIEIVVVDDGSADGTSDALVSMGSDLPWALNAVRQEGGGPAAARNRGMRSTQAGVCLFIGDDTRASEGMVERHLDLHRSHPAPTDAFLGRVVPAPPLDESAFIHWLHERGTQFGYAFLDPGCPVSPECFWTSNVSVKREFALADGGFDESFPGAACEDAELGLRLARRGMKLHYAPDALGEHYHPTDLERTLERMRTVGVAYRRLCELAPEMPVPSRPSARHRLKAAALTAAMTVPIRPARVRETTWRFLCDEVMRESYWGLSTSGPGSPAIGGRLAHLALGDSAA